MQRKSLKQTWHYVENWAEKTPGNEAIIFENERLNFKQFKKKMDLVAKGKI